MEPSIIYEPRRFYRQKKNECVPTSMCLLIEKMHELIFDEDLELDVDKFDSECREFSGREEGVAVSYWIAAKVAKNRGLIKRISKIWFPRPTEKSIHQLLKTEPVMFTIRNYGTRKFNKDKQWEVPIRGADASTHCVVCLGYEDGLGFRILDPGVKHIWYLKAENFRIVVTEVYRLII